MILAENNILNPEPETPEWSNKRILLLLALGTLIVGALWHLPAELSFIGAHAGELIFTLVLAMAFTYLLRPSVNFLHRRLFARSKSGRTLAAAFVFIGFGLLLWLFVAIGLRPATQDIRELWHWFVAQGPQGREDLIAKWQETLEQAIAPYRSLLPPDLDLDLKNLSSKAIAASSPRLKSMLGSAGAHVGFIVELLLLPVLVFYFLTDGAKIRNEAKLLVPREHRARAGRMMAHLDRVLDGYIRGQVIMCLIAWLAVTVMMLVLGVPHAFTLGLIAGITRAIPVIGPLLGGVPLVLVCLLTTRSFPITVTLLSGFILMHFVESKVLLPKIIGHEVDLHPVSVIIVLLIGLEFFGFLGVFLAVPVAAVLKILLAEWHDARELREREDQMSDRPELLKSTPE